MDYEYALSRCSEIKELLNAEELYATVVSEHVKQLLFQYIDVLILLHNAGVRISDVCVKKEVPYEDGTVLVTPFVECKYSHNDSEVTTKIHFARRTIIGKF